MLKSVIESMLEKEMDEYLGRNKGEHCDCTGGNSSNGTTPKTLKISFGKVKIAVPRDRNSGFNLFGYNSPPFGAKNKFGYSSANFGEVH